MPATQHDFLIEQGAKFNPKLLYMEPTFRTEAITGITNAGRAVVDCESHGLTIDWPVYIVGVVGMEQINHKSNRIGQSEYAYQARVQDVDTLVLELDTSRYGVYVSGGELLYRPPVNLTGWKARMHIREAVDSSTALVTLTTENGGILLGGTAGTVEPKITATASALLTFTSAVYDLELLPNGVEADAFRFLEGKVKLTKEVTR